MKQKRLLISFVSCVILLVSALHSTPSMAQKAQRTISGRVTDMANEPIVGLNVVVKGTTTGVATGLNGEYSLSIPDDNGTVLVFSFLGYKTQEIMIGGRTVLDITMSDDATSLEDVVVIGYGTQTKASITGALSTVDTEELIKAPVASITNVLAGSVPGVSTVQTTGQPGNDSAAIYIRGEGSLSSSLSSPLVLVDGVERDFSQIDPNEIENFSILKDAASTAVFGVRGANGVILITTKRGVEGRPSISVSTITGVQQPLSYVQQTGSYEFARFWNIKQQNDGATDRSLYFTREAIEAYRTGSDPIMYPSIKWGDLMFNDLFLQSKNNINISGGGKNVRYFVSLGYLYQNGVLKQMDYLPYNNNYSYNRYNYRANVDFNLTNTTTMKLNIGGNVGKTQEPRTIEDITNGWVYATVWAVPMGGPGFINGVRTLLPKGFIPEVEMRDGFGAFYGYGYNQYYKTTLNIDAEITQNLDALTKGLSVSVKGAYDNYFRLDKYRTGGGAEYQTAYYKSYLEDPTKPQTDPDYDKTILYIPTGTDTPLSYSEDYKRDRNWYLEARVNYSRSFGSSGDHKVTALFLYNQSRDYYPTYSNGATASYQYIPRGYVGFVGRATYGYRNKYLVDVNIGYNGSENFAPGKTRYGAFPSASLGWVMSEEGFMRNQKFINYLKLRASWGRVGNDQSNQRFMYMPSVWTSSGSYSFGINNPNNAEAYGHGTPGNTGVTWETAEKQNYGIDLKFFNSRLSATFDYFIEHRTGILISPESTPNIIATSLPNLNIGKVNNHGYEISLGWRDRIGKNFGYYVDANVSFARNKILYMDEVPKQFSYMNHTGGSTGRYSGLYNFVRLYQYSDFTTGAGGELVLNPELPQPSVKVYPGDAMYADLNGDHVVDGNDKCVTGFATRPEYVFGMNMGFNWKGFDLSMQWVGSKNVNRMYEIEYRIPYTNAGKRGLLTYFYDGCWTEENQLGAVYPRASETSESWNSEPSTLWLADASYLRLKSLSLSYTLTGKKFLKKLGLTSLGFNFSGYNLLTFSPLKYLDPESNPDNYGEYPLIKVYSFGLNLNF